MKKILGLDLGTSSIGWAVVQEAETQEEQSSIVKLGVRVNPLTVDEKTNFEQGKSITTNADRALQHGARLNLHRYKMRRENLIEILKREGFITDSTLLSESGNRSTFETYMLRAKAACEEIALDQFARVLLMINKKRGYKSNRKMTVADEGMQIDSMGVARMLYERQITPGQYVLELLQQDKKNIPDFYRSDLQAEFDRIWDFQQVFYPDILTPEFKQQLQGKGKSHIARIFLGKQGVYTAENTGKEKRRQSYKWRNDGIDSKLTIEQVAYVLSEIGGAIANSSGYLGAISDRSKELFFNKQTVGQYQMAMLAENPNYSLRNQVFYRQDYLDEFERIWETQSGFHQQLTPALKAEVRDVVIFYQRRLKSKKHLIGFCEFESRQIVAEVNGKTISRTVGLKVCPKSSPVFQEFKIWQVLNNVEVLEKSSGAREALTQEQKELLFAELSVKASLTQAEALKLLFKNHRELELNYKTLEGNRTQALLYDAYRRIIELSGNGEYSFSKMSAEEITSLVKTVFEGLGYNTNILSFNAVTEAEKLEEQEMFKLWHMLYSYEGDDSKSGNDKLIAKLSSLYGFEREYAIILANVNFGDDYGALSTKAMRRMLPYLQSGNQYDLACQYAGYRHSKSSLTREELDRKVLADFLVPIKRNELRNPVVEKILNQMINVINEVIKTYGKPDEIRVELARELKKCADERKKLTEDLAKSTKEQEVCRKELQQLCILSNPSRNDIIRYRLYKELKNNGYRTLYSNTYIPIEKLFSKEFDIEHIIPQAKLFDDSFSNKTLEARGDNIDKGSSTAKDYVRSKYGDSGVNEYLARLDRLLGSGDISKGKYNKLRMTEDEIPDGFINRDLRDTQYIAKKAREILESLVRCVVPTTGAVTSRLREDWQLVDVMKELNWDKYEKIGQTTTLENRDGHKIQRIKDWTKRNDHRHHAMDALTIAFTKRSFIQYLNFLNARTDEKNGLHAEVIGIEKKELYRYDGKLRFNPPMPLGQFRSEAKRHLESTLVSIKSKGKVVTTSVNSIKTKNGVVKKRELTPRGPLHKETIYGGIRRYVTKWESVGSAFDLEKIATVTIKRYREALISRLAMFDNNPKKAFTGKNSLEKNPIYLDDSHQEQMPLKVKTVAFEDVYTIRKPVAPDLSIDKVVDTKVRRLLEKRLAEHDGDPKKAFVNLDENPIWLNEQKRIAIKRVTITGISNAIALHDKRDKEGHLIVDQSGTTQSVDFVSPGNNHHVAIFRDPEGKLHEHIVSFFEAVERAQQGLPVVDRAYNRDAGWELLLTMRQNEYVVFPNLEQGFNPSDIDLFAPDNYPLISRNLFRVQKLSTKDYWFRHHLETTVEDRAELKGITWIRCLNPNGLNGVVKVRVNHIGQIVSVGEY